MYHLTFFMNLSYLPPFFSYLQRLSVPIKIKHILYKRAIKSIIWQEEINFA
jgi:hypothetical protein